MPYKKKYNSKKYDIKKKKSYRSRFNDKKINTAIEYKIKAIAKREDQKNILYYFHKNYVTVDATWSSDQAQVPVSNRIPLSNTQIFYTLISNIGNNIYSGNAVANQDGNNRVKVKTVQAHLNIAYDYPRGFTAVDKVRVRASIIYIPNINSNTDDISDRLTPDIYNMGGTPSIKYNGIFRTELKNASSSSNSATDAHIVATKLITLTPRPSGNIYETVDNKFLSTPLIASKNIVLSKTYKNGRMLWYNPQDATQNNLMSNGNFYLAIATDSLYASSVLAYGVCGCRYSLSASTKSA